MLLELLLSVIIIVGVAFYFYKNYVRNAIVF